MDERFTVWKVLCRARCGNSLRVGWRAGIRRPDTFHIRIKAAVALWATVAGMVAMPARESQSAWARPVAAPRTAATGSPGTAVQAAPATAKVVYFTFDDGPSQRYTPQILDILAQHHVRATFFVLGFRCREFPDIVRRIRREGHQIGSHGFDHRSLLAQSEQGLRAEVLRTDEVVMKVCGVRPLYFRPPGGLVKPGDEEAIHRLGHPIAMWTLDSQDWKARSAAEIVRNVESGARSGAIVLFHDGVSNSRLTVQALPELIQYFAAHNYRFQTLPPPLPASAPRAVDLPRRR
ncbi:MAG: polysaccharide deacetylase family protein [Alicyclobacillus sp.]|nr:polysaccharide deacetylase family protein [Alicyclobacillus sp.]